VRKYRLKKFALSGVLERAKHIFDQGCPLIFQDISLPELAP
jgi:hypothetical protein